MHRNENNPVRLRGKPNQKPKQANMLWVRPQPAAAGLWSYFCTNFGLTLWPNAGSEYDTKLKLKHVSCKKCSNNCGGPPHYRKLYVYVLFLEIEKRQKSQRLERRYEANSRKNKSPNQRLTTMPLTVWGFLGLTIPNSEGDFSALHFLHSQVGGKFNVNATIRYTSRREDDTERRRTLYHHDPNLRPSRGNRMIQPVKVNKLGERG